ncbi:MAG: PA2169 family four-helix-bundle protein [Gammaproteobacteria bacterium]|nr:PA2169 family four-helix-bundle protein [Gammaproteobacteria bacterium]MBU1508307.1 PA2169 family four-helix-bundle protein [Gammaproteobacteria bacterium]MBU2122130.1 PA2169 family four-helix-bundle protein [Gammaproteobacteria bacterium]MBU2169771.1 PA2169 family four-helix-bundle protein [Gammaproteobacteria bacterium]MBU2199615.1 PA2169 family four-helix-bundle protein [Gammaproteobacteria bacterium]
MSDFNDANRDPLTNEPGAHPVGTGVGAAMGGAAAGAAAGAFGGPVGAAIGGVAGAVAGGLAGKAAAEAVNPTEEDAYWRENYEREPYFVSGRTYDHYRPAYELGWSSVGRYEGDFEAVEPRLADDWRARHASDGLAWTDVRPATRAAWDRASGTALNNDRPMDVLDNDDVVDVLNDLLESSRDGEYGFHASAEHAESGELKGILQRHSRECAAAAVELEHEIRRLGGDPASGGTVSGALHRGWVSVKTALSTNDDKAVLEECERGEDAAVARYRKALKANLPADIRALVERQSQGAQRNHDEVRALRDGYSAKR